MGRNVGEGSRGRVQKSSEMVGKSEVPSRHVRDRAARPRWRRIAIDLTPLRDRDFRLLWSGEILSEIGSNITLVAVYLQVYALDRTRRPRSGSSGWCSSCR